MNREAAGGRISQAAWSRLSTVLYLIVIVHLFIAIYALQRRFDQRFGAYRVTEEILYIDNGQALKKVLLGFENLAADLYWLRTVQYFGGKRLDAENKDFDLLEPLLNITTDLDPKLKIAYRYGAVFLSEAFPRGQGSPELGIRLIDKGIAANPEYWHFYLDKGFIYYWFLHDYKKAADVFMKGSKVEGAPYWMMATAGRMMTLGGERDVAREIWKFLYETAENDQMRGNASVHLDQLDAMDAMDDLNELSKRYEAKSGRFPESWQELIDAGLLRAVPVDPTGVPFVLNPQQKRVEISLQSELAGLPRPPGM